MHPIERLRYLARLDPSRVDVLAREAAEALLACAAEPAELVVACRRLLDRHPAAGPLWWVASTALTATDAHAALLEALGRLEDDPTPLLVEAELAARPGALAVAAWSYGTDGAFASADEVGHAVEAHANGATVLVAGGVGRALPPRLWRVAVERVRRLPARRPSLLAWASVSAVVGPEGPTSPGDAVAEATCPIAAELLGPIR